MAFFCVLVFGKAVSVQAPTVEVHVEVNQRLLVFGDLSSEVELVEQRLSMAGQTLASMYVHSSGAFIDSVGRFRPDLIVFDCTQPGLEPETALQLSRARPQDVAFLIVSKDGDEHTITECIEAGACDCITRQPAARFLAVVISALERCRLLKDKENAEAAQKLSMLLNRDLFEASPVPLWREDFSGVSSYIDVLHQRGVHDFRSYFDQHPEGVRECASLVRILDINGATVEFFGAKNREELRAHLASVYCEETWEVLKEQLIAIGEGRKILEMNATYADLTGRRMQGRLRWLVAASHERSYSEVILSLLDTTRHLQAEKEIGMFAHTIRSVSECVAIADMQDNLLFVNEAFRKTYGYEDPEILGRNVSLVRSPNNPLEITREILPATLRGGWRGELLNRRKNGSEFPVQLSTSVIRDAEGRPLATVGIATDITDRRGAEEELFRSRSMLQLILDNIPQRVFWKGLDFRYLGCNQPCAQDALLEKPQDIIGRDDFELSWKESAARYRMDDKWVIETGRSKLNFEEPQSKPDGSPLWLRTNKVPLHDRNGRVIGVLGTYEDITESKRAEEALRASEEKYRKFFEEDLSGDYIATPEGKILACNPTFAQIFGFDSVEEALSTNAGILFPSTQAREEFLNKLRDQKMLARHEAELRRKDGRPVYVVENAVGIFGEAGELREIKGYIFDDTDRKKLEDQLRQSQKMEAIGRLAGGVAHDFNNLLTCITGYCDLLLNEIEPSNPMRKDVEEIRDAGERASVLVRQLLAFSRRQVLLPRLLDLDLVIAGLEKLVRRLIGEDINLRILRNGTLGCVKADPGQIEQVIMNLVVNSRDAMPNGGDLVIETANVHLDPDHSGRNDSGKSGPHVMILVRDTGCGMSEEVKSHLFEPFFTTKEGGKGTGLGLSTLYGIVKQSGGSIALESEEGRGTTFKIFLPHADGDSENPAARHRSSGLPRGFETVLVVEDDEAVQSFSVKTLRSLGYSVLQARDGEEAMRLGTSHQGPIHLLLTDVVMPGMSGRELARRILEARPDTRVLFVSGYYEKAGSRPSESGPDEALLAKPFTPQSLGSAVRNVLDRL